MEVEEKLNQVIDVKCFLILTRARLSTGPCTQTSALSSSLPPRRQQIYLIEALSGKGSPQGECMKLAVIL